ncbi:LOW QUALITY PROTEIN: leukocyte immunoglobulin-like receptor subfamily A member 6 [Mus caroli]|uniref:LOW QUALITY PROTEIN: leukocyte immunoglobulin-like receptor subfamily A member 6 n=1 Tax=Mus caroli TaxID=10089 RepID=A0A6P5PYG3_MUSCR|nr:LOW QUALITY PROTEIN: leukocyte immunoglobulin-like receptor subfamily A member 6 [Mus caroli]
MDSQYNHSSGKFEILFALSSLTPNQRRTWIIDSELYVLHKEESPQTWDTQTPEEPENKGGIITLQCLSIEGYEKFILTKEDKKFLTTLDSWSIHFIGQYQALLSISIYMTPDHKGTCRCYGYYKNCPHLLSLPSDPLEVYISVEENQDHTMENLIRMGMAVVVLIVLSILATEAWRSHRQTHRAAGN